MKGIRLYLAAAATATATGLLTAFTGYVQKGAPIDPAVASDVVTMPAGIDAWNVSPADGSTGIGVVVPIDATRAVNDDLFVEGRVDYAWLGVTAGDTPASTIASLGLGIESGALIHGVFDGSPAKRAGLEPGDVVTHVDGRRIIDAADLVRTVGAREPGTRAVFSIVRDARSRTLTVLLSDKPDSEGIGAAPRGAWPGFAVVEQPDLGRVVVAAVDKGGRADSRLLRGDIIRRVDGSPVVGLGGFYRRLDASSGDRVLLDVERDGASVAVRLGR
jgi:serine protease Do